jgi:hypothetical protein
MMSILTGLRGQISKRLVVGIFLIVLATLLIYSVISLWPTTTATDAVNNNADGTPEQEDEAVESEASVFGIKFHISDEARLIFLVMLVGALGSYIYVATSFARHIGAGDFDDNWIWWYVIRPFNGMALAVIFYFVIRGGLLFLGSGNGEVDIYGAVAMAGIVGMFSRQAIDKLKELFDTLFRTREDNGN